MTPPISRHDGLCVDGSNRTPLRVRAPPGSGFTNFTFPALPEIGSAALSFAITRATLALAPGCVTSSGVSANADNGPGTRRNLWIGRVDEVPVLPLSLDTCGCGVAIFVGGSGGDTGDNLRYMRHLAANGYSTVAVDTMAGAPSGEPNAYPRHRDSVPSVSRQVGATDTYWCANELFSDGCTSASQGGAYAACFSSNTRNILYDPAGWAGFYERIYTLRAREVDTLLNGFEETFGKPRRLFLQGNSEGAMVVARYSHPRLEQYGLAGRILTQYSCDYTYFVSCRARTRLGPPVVPVLNMLSAEDPFFGSEAGSIAADVAAGGSGWGDSPPSGSCAAQMRAQGVRGASIKQLQPYHDTVEQAGSLTRDLTTRFVRDPAGAFEHGVLAFDGVSLNGTLCKDEVRSGGVLSATCHSLEEYIRPRDPSTFDATKCGWASERVRPRFIGFDRVPPTCARGDTSVPSAGASLRLVLLHAAFGALACGLLGLLAAAYMHWFHGWRIYVPLKEESTEATRAPST